MENKLANFTVSELEMELARRRNFQGIDLSATERKNFVAPPPTEAQERQLRFYAQDECRAETPKEDLMRMQNQGRQAVETPYWLCCGSTDPLAHTGSPGSCYRANPGHPERIQFGTLAEHRAKGVA